MIKILISLIVQYIDNYDFLEYILLYELLNIIISVMGTIVISLISLCNSILLLRVD